MINDQKLLLYYAKEFLLKERFIAPSDDHLLRKINSAYAKIREAAYELICSKLNSQQLELLDLNEIYLFRSGDTKLLYTGFDKLDLCSISAEYITNSHTQ